MSEGNIPSIDDFLDKSNNDPSIDNIMENSELPSIENFKEKKEVIEEEIKTDNWKDNYSGKEIVEYTDPRELILTTAGHTNVDNLIKELEKQNFIIDKPPIGIPFNIPLNILEKI